MTNNIDWEAVYDEELPRLYNYFRYRTGDSSTAQDLTAMTLHRAWRYREGYRSDLGAFEAWLFQIARNVAADHLRHQRLPDLELDAAEHIAADLSVEREVEYRSDADLLYRLLSRLTPPEQELIALKYGGELTNRAIARITGKSESNVGTTLHRLIQRLRREWGKVESEYDARR
jgi:RNA polymerase sigma-70 factor, ECF subfamily